MKHQWIIGAAITLGFVLGGAAMWIYQRETQPEFSEIQTGGLLDDMFDGDFFARSRDPFQEMNRMRRHLDSMFRDDMFSNRFDTWFGDKFGGFDAQSIRVKEDDKAISYFIDVKDKDVVDLQVDVADGYVTIAATLREERQNRVSESSITQRFPVPANADPNSVTVDKESDAVVIRFEKLTT